MNVLDDMQLPERIEGVDELEALLATPTRGLVEDFARLDGDLMILGVGGKVGPTLALMARAASPDRKVIGVARFSDPDVRRRLEAAGVECLPCDLLEPEQVAKLPDAANVVYMAGRKFGTAGGEPFTWAMNVSVPTFVARRFRDCRIVAFSTLCAVPFVDVRGPGADEQIPPTPFGEYANSCVGRERVFQHFGEQNNCPGRLIRLNYAIDLRYGVLQDVALRVRAGEAIDLSTPVANIIWQGDAAAWILRSLLHCTTPPTPLNVGMARPVRIQDVANRFGERFGRRPVFVGLEQPTAWHADCSEAARLFGEPVVNVETMIRWNADWIERDMAVYGKPTHYEQRGGVF